MKSAKSLTNCRILVTRPEHQSKSLASVIVKRGGIPLLLPQLRIKNLPLRHPVATWKKLQNSKMIIFTSVNAVENFIGQVRGLKNYEASKIQAIAIGQATAKRLLDFGIKIMFEPVDNPHQGASEGILIQHKFSAAELAGETITLIKGQGGRKLLVEQLQKRGARVQTIDVYQREQIYAGNPDSLLVLEQKLLDLAPIHVVVATSIESITTILQVLAKMSLQLATEIVNTCYWVCFSSRIALHIAEFKFANATYQLSGTQSNLTSISKERILIVPRTSGDGIVTAIEGVWRNLYESDA